MYAAEHAWAPNGAATPRDALAERFWALVDRGSADGCWRWTGMRTRYGIGLFRVAVGLGGLWRANRVAWTFVNGPIPTGARLRRTCATPACIAPHHARLVNAKLGAPRCVKLTPDTVRAMRGEYAAGGVTAADLGRKYGVHPTTAQLVLHRRTWREVE